MSTVRFHRQAQLASVLTTLLCGGVSAASGGEFVFRTVALHGQAAPGTQPGEAFFGSLEVPLGAAPLIDEKGDVAFHAFLAPGNTTGIWAELDGALDLVALRGTQAPGTPPGIVFVGFPPLAPRTPARASGRTAFLGSVNDVLGQSGIWSEGPGELELVARIGDPAPGVTVGSTFRAVSPPRLSPAGLIALNALFRRPGLAFDEEGLWSDRSGSLEPMVVEGDPAPGTAPGVVFGEGGIFAAGGAFRSWAFNQSSRLVINGNLKGPGIDDFNDEGVWLERPTGGLSLLAREGARAPGLGPRARLGGGNGIDAFGQAVPLLMSTSGAVLFESRVHGLGGTPPGSGTALWTNRSGRLKKFVLGSDGLVGSAPADPVPGLPGRRFLGFRGASINAANQIAFVGLVQPSLSGFEGIWWDRPGTLTPLALQGEQVPGAPAGTAFDRFFGSFRLAADGHLSFSASLTGGSVDPSNDLALLLADPGGLVHIVVREGDPFDVVGDGSDIRTIVDIQAGNLNDSAQLVFKLLFADQSVGIFTGSLVSPADQEATLP